MELEIPIPPQDLAAAEERAFRKLAKHAKIPGFRPGKAPRRVFENQYGTDSIANQAMEDIVPEVYSRALKEHELEPVEHAKMEVLPREDGAPLTIKATVSVRPEILLQEYKGIVVQGEPAVVNEDDLERSLQALVRERASLVPVNRPVELGDTVTIDYEGTMDGVPFEGGSARAQTTEISEDRFIPGFASGIVGMKSGETKEVQAHFPSDYEKPEVAGKLARFTVTVHEVKELELPAVNDAFAASVSANKTLAELKSDIHKRLSVIAESQAKKAVGNRLMQALLDMHDFPVPEIMVQRETASITDEAKTLAQRMGMTWEDYVAKTEKTPEALHEQFTTEAIRRVKGTLLLEEIAKKEKIEATKAEVETELAGLATQYQQPRERILEALQPNITSFLEGIVRRKTVNYLLEHATVTQAT